jgi:hypothetical protein
MARLKTVPAVEYDMTFSESERLQIVAALRLRMTKLSLDKECAKITSDLIDLLVKEL